MASAPLAAPVRPYRDYLTPALHRRFNKASLYTLLLCYAIAAFMGPWDSFFWALFPVGPVGARTLMVFIPALVVYILRVAQWHVGRRQTLTPFETVKKYSMRKSNVLTLVFYVFSAWIYSEVYLWSAPPEARLGLTEMGREYERIKLNERSFYLRYLFLMLGVAQSVAHVFFDLDHIDVVALKPKKDYGDTAAATATPVRRGLRPREVLVKHFVTMIRASISITAVTLSLGSILYFLGLRGFAWEYWYKLHRWWYSLSKTSRPTGLAPFVPLVSRFVLQAIFLSLLWNFVNKAFSLYVAQEPLKNDQPITQDSKDPNGTLLNGLKSKKDAVKAMAFCELALITDAFPDRRQTIYTDDKRPKGNAYEQITTVSLAEIKFLINRLSVGLDPTYAPEPVATDNSQPPPNVDLVPRIARPLRESEQVIASPTKGGSGWDRVATMTADVAKQQSASTKSEELLSRKYLKKGVNYAHENVQKTTPKLNSWRDQLIHAPFGRAFRQSFQRSTKLVVLGAPYSRFSFICNAVTALTNLAVFSVKQDTMGRFHEGVPEIVRVFSAAISKLDTYMASTPIAPSDQETQRKPEAERRKVTEIEEIRECLREALEMILETFNDYLSDMGMSRLEITDAKSAAGAKKTEMVQTSSN